MWHEINMKYAPTSTPVKLEKLSEFGLAFSSDGDDDHHRLNLNSRLHWKQPHNITGFHSVTISAILKVGSIPVSYPTGPVNLCVCEITISSPTVIIWGLWSKQFKRQQIQMNMRSVFVN